VWAEPAEPQQRVRLIQLAWARSGDKGDMSNIGVVARRPEWLPLLWDRLTPEVVQAYFQHLVHGRVERFHLPGISAINYLLHQALDGGGPASSRIDPLGKGMAQMLLDIELLVPASVAAKLV
jgi:diadenosine tetraphosphatase ApaH/serine/threonine PP2A family protein phosphatase